VSAFEFGALLGLLDVLVALHTTVGVHVGQLVQVHGLVLVVRVVFGDLVLTNFGKVDVLQDFVLDLVLLFFVVLIYVFAQHFFFLLFRIIFSVFIFIHSFMFFGVPFLILDFVVFVFVFKIDEASFSLPALPSVVVGHGFRWLWTGQYFTQHRA